LAAADESSPEYIAARKEFVTKAVEASLREVEQGYWEAVNRETEEFNVQREERWEAVHARVGELDAEIVTADVAT
jgi:hypothetical protein